MSINAAFAGGVPGRSAPDHRVPGVRTPPGDDGCSNHDDSCLEAEVERWYERRGWSLERDAHGRLWLPVGAQFDIVEVPEEAGRRALRRLIGYGQAALAPGPVALAAADRCCFFVAPGARDDLPELLDWLDWGGIDLGLRAHGAGDRIAVPARDRWLHDPLAVPPEVIALLATIAESCSRYALTHRAV
jgi:hypothetical protein